eukprot:GEMP01034963.1.p1 GENE.GEMP01034963.1~~GEMP01034963.1.p1  ORF type:complete len:402 (+),score=93.65 GEMP01034963.1:511-1716(+)
MGCFGKLNDVLFGPDNNNAHRSRSVSRSSSVERDAPSSGRNAPAPHRRDMAPQKNREAGGKEETKPRASPRRASGKKKKKKKTTAGDGVPPPKSPGSKCRNFTQLDTLTRAPDYWKCHPLAPYKLYAIKHKSPLFEAFREVLATDKPKQLNKGRDVREVGEYSMLDLVGVWRIENARIWANYATERARMQRDLESRNARAPNFFLRKNLYTAVQKLPGIQDFWTDINETYLIHGTVAEWILPIAKNGISPPLTSAALFGKGSYFAEDSAKNDQYVKGDFDLQEFPDLHKKIFPPGGEFPFPKPPYKAYYLVLCRVLIGYPVCVKCTECEGREMFNVRDGGSPIFASAEERELANIPNIDGSPMPYQSLIAEKGFAVVRFREFCLFHAARVYPEYLMCYSRK